MRWNRREFLKHSLLGLAAGALPAGSASARTLAGALAHPVADNFTPLRRRVGIFTQQGGTIGWLASLDGLVVVDSQFPDPARNFLTGLRSRTSRPIDVLINTHHHSDHTGGNGVIGPAAGRIVAHRRVPELQRTYEDNAPQTYPNTTFDDEWSLTLGDETVRAKHYGAAHTGGDATIFFERANIVHMGDLMFNRMYPFVDGPAGASIRGWVGLLETVMDEHGEDTLYIFGHARSGFDVTGGRDELGLMRDFLSALLESAEAGVRAGRSEDEVAGQEAPAGFPDHQGNPAFLQAGYRVAYQDVVGS